MYVPGKLDDPDKVLVDVGTGYYVEKDVDKAKDYFNKKVKYVTEQMEKIQVIGNEKNKVREAVMDVMEGKLQQQFAQNKAANAANAAAPATEQSALRQRPAHRARPPSPPRPAPRARHEADHPSEPRCATQREKAGGWRQQCRGPGALATSRGGPSGQPPAM